MKYTVEMSGKNGKTTFVPAENFTECQYVLGQHFYTGNKMLYYAWKIWEGDPQKQDTNAVDVSESYCNFARK